MSNRETSFSLPKTEMYYFDEGNNTYKPLATAGAIPVIVVGGNGTGGSAMNFLSGSGVPSNDVGANGDVYLNSVNGDLYKKESSTWSVIANLKGLKGDAGTNGTNATNGAKGADGATWLSGATAPTSTLGKTGDFYLNTATSDVYSKATGSWVLSLNIKGATGATGANGTNGTNGAMGADGATWLFGTAVPTTYYIYTKSSNAWALSGNIKGTTGANGFGTQAQYDDIIARLEALEQGGTPTP